MQRSRVCARLAGLFILALGSTAHADINISKKQTQNVSCSGWVCVTTAKNAILNVADLTNMLAAGDVTVKYGGGALAIQINDGFSWTSGSHLTLDANTSVGFHKPVTVAGQGALTITTNDGGTGGDLKFFDKGKIDFWDLRTSLVVAGNAYTLVKDIRTLAQDISTKPTGHFALAKNYNAIQDGTYGASPVTIPLGGTFEGLGHSIDALTISSSAKCLGLFAAVSAGGTVRDMRLTSVIMSSVKKGAIGAAVGCNAGSVLGNTTDGSVTANIKSEAGGVLGQNDGSASRLESSVTVKANYFSAVGGVIGLNNGTVSDSAASGPISAQSFSGRGASVGGLVGHNSGSIIGSVATGDASGGGWAAVGGLVGYGEGSISLSHATGSVKSDYYGAGGGLAGESGPVDQSYATGNVTLSGDNENYEAYSGGLVGAGGPITNSYAMGAVVGVDRTQIGGLLGAGNNISTSYSIGQVTDQYDDYVNIGGLVGLSNNGTFTNNVWDITTSGQTYGCADGSCPGITGLTDTQLKSGLPAGFDPNIWGSNPNINSGYPYLLANPPQ